jgi:serine/threonine protein kinase
MTSHPHLAYIHSRSVVHLDVKPANVLVTAAEDRCKLTDFGCSLHLADEPNDSAGLVPDPPPQRHQATRHLYVVAAAAAEVELVVYSAPELFQTDDLRQSGKSLVKADIYSLGVTLWQLAARRYPFDEYRFSACAVIYAVVEFGARPDGTGYDACGLPPPSTCPTVPLTVTDDAEIDYVKTYSRCWRDEPDARPTTADLVPLFDVWRRHRRN